MTLPASGPISMSQVAAELGISATGLSLNDSRVRALAGKPSGAISFADLLGKSAAGVVNPLPITVIYDEELSPTNASAQVGLSADGTISVVGNGSSAGPNWYAPTTAGIGSSYWAKLVVNSGAGPTSGSGLGIVSLAGGANWIWGRSSLGSTTANVTLGVYSDAGATVLVASKTFNVTSSKTS